MLFLLLFLFLLSTLVRVARAQTPPMSNAPLWVIQCITQRRLRTVGLCLSLWWITRCRLWGVTPWPKSRQTSRCMTLLRLCKRWRMKWSEGCSWEQDYAKLQNSQDHRRIIWLLDGYQVPTSAPRTSVYLGNMRAQYLLYQVKVPRWWNQRHNKGVIQVLRVCGWGSWKPDAELQCWAPEVQGWSNAKYPGKPTSHLCYPWTKWL